MTKCRSPVSEIAPWSPDSPALYDLEIALKSGDSVQSYFAMRKVDFRKDSAGLQSHLSE